MSRRVVWDDLADIELDEAVRFYEGHSDQVARSFLAEIDRALQHVIAFPEGSPLAGRDARRKPLASFPFNLYYKLRPKRIFVIALAHQSREPRYWSDRT